MFCALLIATALVAQEKPETKASTRGERYAAAKKDFNEKEVSRREALQRELGKKLRAAKGSSRAAVANEIATNKAKLEAARDGTLDPLVKVGDYAVGRIGFIVDDPLSDKPKAPSARVILLLDVFKHLDQTGYLCELAGDKVVIQTSTVAAQGDRLTLNLPIEVTGVHKSITGSHWVLRTLKPAAGVQKSASKLDGKTKSKK